MFTSFLIVLGISFLLSIRQINPNQIGIVFRFGKFTRVIKPGWRIVIIKIESHVKITDTETLSEKQLMELIKDGVPHEIIDKLRKKS
ncbi:hypothetical protein HOF40_03455 [Candidatus Parcubacteria bacterium]|jgi:regulator of protease activity HflC (stomatin/prohibitin superfamily)|nr:hypothetical protein [Candidatus Parcubacteria bacterium]MBT3949117.1 hypothetical protein [Candidatus Parcubacteria bacterium]